MLELNVSTISPVPHSPFLFVQKSLTRESDLNADRFSIFLARIAARFKSYRREWGVG